MEIFKITKEISLKELSNYWLVRISGAHSPDWRVIKFLCLASAGICNE